MRIATVQFAFAIASGVTSAALAQEIPLNASVSLRVGQSAVLKGVRGRECHAPAMSWSQIRAGLPATPLGVFSDGGTGTTVSRACGGPTPARGVRFTARKSGSETVTIYGDPISITVQ